MRFATSGEESYELTSPPAPSLSNAEPSKKRERRRLDFSRVVLGLLVSLYQGFCRVAYPRGALGICRSGGGAL